MTANGRFLGVVRDELATASDVARQAVAGVDPSTSMYRANMRRLDATADLGALTTQVMTSVPVYLRRGDVVTSISVRSGATAAGTPTNWWFALYSNAATPALLGQTADQLTTAWGATTNKTLALASPVTIQTDGTYWVGIMVKATTVPSLVGVSTTASAGIVTGEKNLAQTSGSALTTTAPATIASPTAAATAPLVIIT
ncbi:hypothetical protein RMN57_13230 [Kitasatospora sp. CM 4170]|uniref:Uncharacterized protein n=1 Tax=Kitasatospora aburaviensis TaxID=67265 RepID=A0ABW1ER25_9ACTN|nr:hypothetical protein [Kitasatospora sp. CM 4170]WNM45617.1 hypothetical protein RMN57_13230 [Kitasatospora sp. CM 4170]